VKKECKVVDHHTGSEKTKSEGADQLPYSSTAHAYRALTPKTCRSK